MKITHLALAALLASGITASSPAAELANPVPGAIVRHFNWKTDMGSSSAHERRFSEQISEFLSGTKPAAETGVDTGETFNTHNQGDRRNSIWDGYIKSASGGVFTFTCGFISDRNEGSSCFSVWINGQQLMLGDRKTFSGGSAPYAFLVALRPGFNSIRIVLEANNRNPLSVTYKKQDSLQAPRNIGPGDLWHEDVVEDEEW